MNYSRDKIRKYIIKTIGRDPQENFQIIAFDEADKTIKLSILFSLQEEDHLELSIPAEKAI